MDLAPWRHDARVPESRATPPPAPPPTVWPAGVSPPRCHADVLEPWCFDSAVRVLDSFDEWHGSGGSTRRPRGAVYGLAGIRAEWQSFFIAGGAIDFTVEPPAPIRPGFEFQTHVRQDFARRTFASAPDQAAADLFQLGVRVHAPSWYADTGATRADMAMLAFAPNLLSMYPDAADAVGKQVAGFEARGWSRRAAHPRGATEGFLGTPSIPFASAPCGGVPKKGTTDLRVIVSLGWPDVALAFMVPPACTLAPAVYYSLNETSGALVSAAGGDAQYYFDESKGSIGEAVHNTCIVGRGCAADGLAIFELSFDFEKWFHQFFYWWRDVCRMGAIVPDVGPEGGLARRLVATLNLVMAMGWTKASDGHA